MSVLSVKPQKNAFIRGIPKVYFCCHPMDFDPFFEDITNEILRKQNCAIWYHGKEPIEYDDEFFERLSQMNLLVVPITKRFLQKGTPALEKEFHFAAEYGIPILPLMQERGLEQSFNELCGNIQFLDKYNTDSTCIEYSDKLDKFLSSVLVGDELAEKIRCAFDAYIFLSYRKKDRSHAQRLMKLIHQNEFCRDIAIWYDEFLVPGENFNSAISDALQKCDLFVLTVTPNLVNETNYVMDVEYPMAKEWNKSILPCEMVATDKELLTEKYENIPECASEHDIVDLSEKLRKLFWNIATNETDSRPEHLFFIGLAYLHGIDVEVNRERAIELLTSAAEQDLPDAIKQLITIYTRGIGVKPDFKKALEWRKKLLETTEHIYEHDKNSSTAYDYVRASFELANADYEMSLFDEAIDDSNRLKTICNSVMFELLLDEKNILGLKHHIALADLLLGQSYHAKNDLNSAKEHYDLSKDLFTELNEKFKSPYILRDTSILYNKMAQLCKVKAEYKEALNYYEEALKIQESNAQKDVEEIHLTDQVISLFNMSEAKRLIGDVEGAKQHCLTAAKILDELIEIHGITKYVGYKMLILGALAESYRFSGNLEGALKSFEAMIPLEEIFIQHHGEVPINIRTNRLIKTTQIYFQLADHELTIQNGLKALELCEKSGMVSDVHIATGGSELASLYLFIGASYYNGKSDFDNAIKYLKLAVKKADEYLERGILCNIPDIIMIYSIYGDILQMNEEISEAGINLEKAAFLYEKHLSGDEDYRNTCTAFVLYVALGKNYMAKERLTDAINMLNKAESLYKKIISLMPDTEESLRRDYALLCNYKGLTCYDNNDPQAKEYCLKCIEIYDLIPEDSYVMNDWNIIGIISYILYDMSRGFIKKRKWKKRLFDAASKIKHYFPSHYKLTAFYDSLGETGIFD